MLVWPAKSRVFNDTNVYMILKLMRRGRNAEQQVPLFCKFYVKYFLWNIFYKLFQVLDSIFQVISV